MRGCVSGVVSVEEERVGYCAARQVESAMGQGSEQERSVLRERPGKTCVTVREEGWKEVGE